MTWFKALSLGGKLIASLVAVLIAAGIIWGAYRTITAGERAKAKLGANQTEAAIESGKDAVATAGGVAKSESDRSKDAEGAKADVRNAKTGADADAAARRGLCQQSPDLC